jgi:hypothetical protein
MRQLAKELEGRLGRGFSKRNGDYMRAFCLGWEIVQTPSAKFEARLKFPTLSGERGAEIRQTLSAKFEGARICRTVSGNFEKGRRQTLSVGLEAA